MTKLISKVISSSPVKGHYYVQQGQIQKFNKSRHQQKELIATKNQ